MERPTPRLLRFGLFEADLGSARLTRNGVRIRLQDQPFRILALLLERAGQIVTREELRQELWPSGTYVDFDGSLNAALKRLRAALDDDADNPRFIETVPKRGYRFIAPVSVIHPDSQLPASPESESASTAQEASLGEPRFSTRSPAPQGKRLFPWFVTSLAFLVLAASATFLALRLHRSQGPGPQKSPHVATSVSYRQSVAVLGFRNVSAKPEDAWLATALTEMFSTELSAGNTLRLVPGEDVARLQLDLSQADSFGQPTTSRLAQALDADLLVLGSYATVRVGRDRQLRLDVRVQDAKTGDIVFETAQTGRIENIFQLVSHAGDLMRDRLGISPIRQEDETSILASLPVGAEAARFYALGLARLRAFDPLDAKDLLIQATQADPRFALAHSVLAEAWEELGYQKKAAAEAKIALALSVNLPQSLKLEIEGRYYESQGKTEKAVTAYRDLFAYYPDCLDCGIRLASAEIRSGHLTDAFATIATLRNLAPPQSDDPRIDFVEQAAYSFTDHTRQLVLLERTVEKAKQRGLLWLYARARLAECSNLAYLGRTAEAMAACREAQGLFISFGDQMGVVRTLLLQAARQSDSGDQKLSLATFQQALQLARPSGSPELIGAVLNGIGNTFERMNRLEESAKNFREARQKYQEAGDIDGVYATSDNLGDVLAGMGLLHEANDAYQQGLDISQSEAFSHSCYAQYSLASLHLTMGDLRGAQQRIGPALEACKALGIARYSAFALGVRADIFREQGRLSDARANYQKAMKIYQQSDSQDLLPGLWIALGRLAMMENDVAGARKFFGQAAASLQKQDNADGLASVDVQLSRLRLLQGKPLDAEKALALAKQASREILDPELRLSVSIQDARLRIAAVAGHPSRASLEEGRAELDAALRTATRLGFYHEQCEARMALAEFQFFTNPEAARSSLNALSKATHDRGFETLSRQAAQLLAHEDNRTLR
jgi:DNA-binding winged helix-turn-helix (wHTH) protein/tetratricopeptide (TPR) repeat protein